MIDPYVSTLALLMAALGGRSGGVPEPWRHRIRAAISPGSAEAVRPLVTPGYSVAPDCLVPSYSSMESRIENQLARLHGLSAEEINADLANTFGDQVPAHWRAVARHPRRWLSGYVRALSEAWSTMRPVWNRARPLFDRELERVGTAVVRGQLDIILGTVHQRSRFEDGTLKIPDPEPARFDLAGRPLVLVPTLSGSDVVICNFDRPDAVWVSYSMPGTERLCHGTLEAIREPSLDLLLGSVRLQIMKALVRPYTMSELAAHTKMAPSAVSYHCDRLKALGLVERQRHGREVRVSRTHRFEYLAELFGVNLRKEGVAHSAS
jgi:DNA-binding transcriptional ArsR family regulator